VFLTLMLVEFISIGQSSVWHVVLEFGREAVLGAIIGRDRRTPGGAGRSIASRCRKACTRPLSAPRRW